MTQHFRILHSNGNFGLRLQTQLLFRRHIRYSVHIINKDPCMANPFPRITCVHIVFSCMILTAFIEFICTERRNIGLIRLHFRHYKVPDNTTYPLLHNQHMTVPDQSTILLNPHASKSNYYNR